MIRLIHDDFGNSYSEPIYVRDINENGAGELGNKDGRWSFIVWTSYRWKAAVFTHAEAESVIKRFKGSQFKKVIAVEHTDPKATDFCQYHGNPAIPKK